MVMAHRHGSLTLDAAIAEVALAAGAPDAEALATHAGLSPAQPAGPFPKLMRRDRAAELVGGSIVMPCAFDPELVVGYVRSLPHGQIPVSLDEIGERWAYVDALHAEAVANLARVTRGVELQGVGAGERLAMGFAEGDGHDAARALLPGVLAAAREWFEGDVLVALPCRDLLLVFGARDADFVREAAAYAASVLEADPQPLTNTFYRLADLPAGQSAPSASERAS
jgi:hypothetical protein